MFLVWNGLAFCGTLHKILFVVTDKKILKAEALVDELISASSHLGIRRVAKLVSFYLELVFRLTPSPSHL